MFTKDKPETLIQLLASYRHATFSRNGAKTQNLVQIAQAIQDNCSATINYADKKLTNLEDDGEEVFTLCNLKSEAMVLKRRCAALAQRQDNDIHKKVESLERQYDNFKDSVRHLFSLLDCNLAGRLDGVL